MLFSPVPPLNCRKCLVTERRFDFSWVVSRASCLVPSVLRVPSCVCVFLLPCVVRVRCALSLLCVPRFLCFVFCVFFLSCSCLACLWYRASYTCVMCMLCLACLVSVVSFFMSCVSGIAPGSVGKAIFSSACLFACLSLCLSARVTLKASVTLYLVYQVVLADSRISLRPSRLVLLVSRRHTTITRRL